MQPVSIDLIYHPKHLCDCPYVISVSLLTDFKMNKLGFRGRVTWSQGIRIPEPGHGPPPVLLSPEISWALHACPIGFPS